MTLSFAIALVVLFATTLAGVRTASAQESQVVMTLTKKADSAFLKTKVQPLSGYTEVRMVSDSAAKGVSPTKAQAFAHTELPWNHMAFVGFVAAGLGGANIYCTVYDTAWEGNYAFAPMFSGLPPGQLISMTGYLTDTMGIEIVPWTLVWTVKMETNGVLTYTQVDNHMTVYPNPAVANATVRLPHGWQNTSFSIVDMQGRVISTFMATGPETRIPQCDLASGNYILSARNADANLRKATKFIIGN